MSLKIMAIGAHPDDLEIYAYNSELHYSRLAWQVRSISID
jgi:LmbE family N-acetylglucosaminyl deacetylase